MSNTITEIKNALEGTNSKTTEAEGWISKLEDRRVKIIAEDKNKRERKIHDKLCSIPAEKLYAQAKKIMKDVELGKFNAKEMEEAEHRLVHLFGAIEGMQQVIILEQDHGPVPL